MHFTLKIWRQAGPNVKGFFQTFFLDGITPDTSFLEMLDILNNTLVQQEKKLLRWTMIAGRGYAVPAVCT